MPRKRRDSQMDLFARPAHPGIPATAPAARTDPAHAGLEPAHAAHLDGHKPIDGPADKTGGYWSPKNWRVVRVQDDGVTVWQSLSHFDFRLQAPGQPDPWERPVSASPSGSPAAPAVQSVDSSGVRTSFESPETSCGVKVPPEPRGTAEAEAGPLPRRSE